MKSKSIPMYEVSRKMGMERSAGRKFALRHGYVFHKRIDPRVNNQPVICLTEDEANDLIELRSTMILDTGN